MKEIYKLQSFFLTNSGDHSDRVEQSPRERPLVDWNVIAIIAMVLSLLDDVLLEFQDGVFDGQSPVLWVEGVVALSDFPKFLYGLQIRT